MADDLPIKITLDPGPASRGAQTLTREVAKTEDGAKKATNAYADFQKQLARIEADAGKAAKAVSSINFKQAASGAWQAFQRVNSELGLMDNKIGHVIGRTVEWGATGAQVAGPWGAAIGAVAGGFVSLIKSISDAEAETRKLREEHEKLAKEYWEGVKAAEQKARVEKELAPAMAEHARLAAEIADREKTLASVMNAQGDSYRKATDRAMAYQDMLFKVNSALAIQIAMTSKLYGKDFTASTPQSSDASASVIGERGLRDATIAAYAADKSYGATLIDLAGSESKHNDRLRDLEQIMGDINVDAEVRNRAFKEYNETLKKGTKEIDAQTKALYEFMRAEAARRNVLDTIGVTPVGSSPGKYTGDNFQTAIDIAGNRGINYDAFAAEDAERALARSRAELIANQQEAQKLNDLIRGQLTQSATSFASALTDASHGADVSWSSTFENILRGLEQAIAQALILKALTGDYGGVKGASGYGGLFGLLGGGATGFDYLASNSRVQLPGFATGGDVYTRGAGPTDSMIFAARITPGESVHVRTPEQRREALRGQSRGLRVVQVSADPRALAPSVSGDDEDTVLLRLAANNRDKLKRLLA